MNWMGDAFDVVVMAAGRGRRLRADVLKPMLSLAGEPLIAHVLAAVAPLSPRRMLAVIPPRADELQIAAREACPTVQFAEQPTPKGTAEAALRGLVALEALQKKDGGGNGMVLIVCADSPLLQTAALRTMRRRAKNSSLSLLCFRAANPRGYGRIVRGDDGKVAAIVEEKEADATQREIDEVFAGALVAPRKWLTASLKKIVAGGKGLPFRKRGGEYYLTWLAEIARREEMAVATVSAAEEEAAGINTMADLAAAEGVLRRRRAEELMRRGAQIADPMRLDIRGQVRGGRGAVIDVGVILAGRVSLGRGAKIGAHSVVCDSAIGAEAEILPFCHLQGATVGTRCQIGPFARLRPGANIGKETRVGNFVEIKNSVLGAKVRANHLAYLGDADIGAGANIGAGVITCNYDGRRKRRSQVGAGAFVGSDSQLIAPVKVGAGAYVAAGTTVAKDAPARHLTMARTPQSSRPLRRKK